MHVIQSRNIPHAYDQLIRLIWSQGRKKIDQRGDETRELKHVFVEITTDDITYPSFGPTSKRYGDNFAEGLIDNDKARDIGDQFDYGYGSRIRNEGALSCIISMLQDEPKTRRAVLPIYRMDDPENAYKRGQEVPCATQIYLDIEDNELNMTLMMRSNDIPGAFPSDAYGFRRLQEHIAKQTNTTVGKYMHYANSAHIIMNNNGDFVKEFVKTPVNWS